MNSPPDRKDSRRPALRPLAIRIAALVVAGLLVVPVLAYIVGGQVFGNYSGSRGLASYLGSLYADAAAGKLLALALLLSPLLVALAWSLRRTLLDRLQADQTK
ncbi:MAG: hypothetical protein FJ197_08845 [Gammaproteobacteria bacterium]|nr:hypothetical protein [Gammaproteobacteria bacterium]